MRLFIGLEPSQEIRSALMHEINELENIVPARYVRGDMLHITLAFIGEMEECAVEKIKSVMDAAACSLSPFAISLGKAGYFGRQEKAILYCGVQECAELHNAAALLRRLLSEAGISYDPQPFNPHITLARKFNAYDSENIKMPCGSFTAGHMTLFHSHRVNDILIYEPVYRSAFNG